MGNFDSFPRKKNTYFHHEPNYDNEKKLFRNLATEEINLHGCCMNYYITTFSTSANYFWGEDQNRSFVRAFDFMGLFNLPEEEGFWNTLGFGITNNIIIIVTKHHFEAAGKTNDICLSYYDEVEPKIGDIIRTEHDGRFWEITEVLDEELMFLQKKQLWEITVKEFNREHTIIPSSVSATMPYLSAANVETDELDISDAVDEKKSTFIYSPQSTEKKKLTGWW